MILAVVVRIAVVRVPAVRVDDLNYQYINDILFEFRSGGIPDDVEKARGGSIPRDDGLVQA